MHWVAPTSLLSLCGVSIRYAEHTHETKNRTSLRSHRRWTRRNRRCLSWCPPS